MLVQTDQLPTLLRLQLHLQQLLLLVQELVEVTELGLDALLQVSRVVLDGGIEPETDKRNILFLFILNFFTCLKTVILCIFIIKIYPHAGHKTYYHFLSEQVLHSTSVLK